MMGTCLQIYTCLETPIYKGFHESQGICWPNFDEIYYLSSITIFPPPGPNTKSPIGHIDRRFNTINNPKRNSKSHQT